jgi:hypothetical protein
MERETITATLKSVAQEQKRTVFVFEDPKNPENEKKYSAFEPNLPQLKIGKAYTFEVEHVPMKNDPEKFYHNLVRTAKDGPYSIKEAAGIVPAPMGIQAKPPAFQPANTIKPAPAQPTQPSQLATEYAEKQKRYEDKEARREARIVRGNSVNAAAEITAALITKGAVEVKGEKQAIDVLKLMARQIEEYILEAAAPDKKVI